MDFIQQVDQLSDDEDEQEFSLNLSNRYSSSNSFNHRSSSHSHNIPKDNATSSYRKPQYPQFQRIKSIDVTNDNDYSDEANHAYDSVPQANTSVNTVNTSSNIQHRSHDQLVSTNMLADKTRNVFNFTHFNPMQSKCFENIYHQDHNCVISSPTGSGKTVLFELAILRLLNTHGNVDNIKILYIAPTKALCIERQNDWNNKFSTFGLTVGTLTSDTGFLEADKVKKANIIITTPEKWDLMTRKWGDYTKLFELIKLLLIDEVHILREDRGSTLEVVVTRMKNICQSIRIIALSATVPNIHDVSSWIKLSSSSDVNALTLVFGEEYRPVKLEKRVFGYKQTSNDWVFDSVLNQRLLENLNQFNKNRKPVLIFCPTRNATLSTAKYISTNYHGFVSNQRGIGARDKDLDEYSKSGISFHHAGLSLEDRALVESGFINGQIKILCCTSTLAVGVNLPAYLVIIKGTKIWNLNQFEEYSELDVLQMMGRAGRPQYEKEALAIVMTSSDKQSHYENFVKGNEKLESRLHLNLHENVVSETYLKTITSLEEAVSWLKHTFFYSRFKSNPTAYNEIPFNHQLGMDERLMKFCESKINELINFELIKIEGREYICTAYGEAMTRHYIFFDTMKNFIKAPPDRTIADILFLISKAKEFETIRLKRTEKKLFKEINESPILKHPLKPTLSSDSKKKISKTIDQNFEKIYLLIQYELGGLEYPSDPQLVKLQQSFKQDKFYVFKHIGRLIRCLLDCFIEKKDYISLVHCLTLARCIGGSCWEDTPMVLKQLDYIGIVSVRRFANQNIRDFKKMMSLQPNKVEYYGSLRPGQGQKLLTQLDGLPKFKIDCSIVKAYKSKTEPNAVVVKIKLDIDSQARSSRWNNKQMTVIVVSGLSNGELVDFRRAPFHKIQGQKSFGLEIKIRSRDLVYSGSISCEEIAGVQETFRIDLSKVLDRSLVDHLAMNNAQSSSLPLPTTTATADDSELEDDPELDQFILNLPSNKLTSHSAKQTDQTPLPVKRLANPVSKKTKLSISDLSSSLKPDPQPKSTTKKASSGLDVLQQLKLAQSNKNRANEQSTMIKQTSHSKPINFKEFSYQENHDDSKSKSSFKDLTKKSFIDESFISEEGFEEDLDFGKLLSMKHKPALVRVKEKILSDDLDETPEEYIPKRIKVIKPQVAQTEETIIEISSDSSFSSMDDKWKMAPTQSTTNSNNLEDTTASTTYSYSTVPQQQQQQRLSSKLPASFTDNKGHDPLADDYDDDLVWQAPEYDDWIYNTKLAEQQVEKKPIIEEVQKITTTTTGTSPIYKTHSPVIADDPPGIDLDLASDVDSMFGSDVEVV
ncbi:hypothetical protein WICPIJ_001159 [Wickerhamomyces pijperi]|uniref:DNA 3'-5' helicase n=1 Tax=Wickerhamomyces pijperi TaxID=599730 RepID=A0A9P8QCA9_WICPI|nr:hypothetical protein WICPIJ_001159 [Wickerhamomyces pijperi]